jgi:tetratricopeptide (TPR) repeat protein
MGRHEEAIESLNESMRFDPMRARTHVQIALAYQQLGERDRAIEILTTALQEMPQEWVLYLRLAEAHAARGDVETAGDYLAQVVELRPESGIARYTYGAYLVGRRKFTESIEHLRAALEVRENFVPALHLLGMALEATAQYEDAARTYLELLEVEPETASVYSQAANLMALAGNFAGAIKLLRAGYELMPGEIAIANDLAWHLATAPDPDLRDGVEAVRLAEYVNSLKGAESCNELDTLAAAYAEVGRFEDAVSTAERALAIARATSQDGLAESISKRLELFRNGQPYRLQVVPG